MQSIVWTSLLAVILLVAGLAVVGLAPADYNALAYCLVGGSITLSILSLRER